MIAGCASDRPSRSERAAVPTEEHTPEMEGHAAFLDGHLEADVLLNRAGFGPRGESGAEQTTPGERSGRGGGGFRGGFGRGGGRRGYGGGSGGRNADSGDDVPAAHIRASNLPPVRLHLRFTNTTDAPIAVAVPQFDSDLGNFVVQPAQITVPAHATAEADPMTSRLGVPADQVPITMTIRAGDKTEHQVVFLKLKSPPPDSSATPAPAPAP